MPSSIRLRWTPAAVDTLIDLEECGMPGVAERIIGDVADRLTKQPGIYREVKIASPGTRRRTTVRRLYFGNRLPYLVYFYYDKLEGVVDIVRIRHVRQKPIER